MNDLRNAEDRRCVADLFEIPDAAAPYTELFLSAEERRMLETLSDADYSEQELCDILEQFIGGDARDFIKDAYSRGVLNKAEHDGEIFYRPADFYTRLAFFTQYEPELWMKIPENVRAVIDEWYVCRYMKKAEPRLDAALRGEGLIENAFFFTLEETLELIDSLEVEPYVVPCNCKSVAMKCGKPREVCINFNRGINSEWDRGHGRALTKEEAKAIILHANKNGLMHTSETAAAICNCCGDCCYPIRASKELGTKGVWPKQRYEIVWNEDKCVGCGKCARVCNFSAFSRDGRKITFNAAACWGCTICKNHCPVGAIDVKKLAEAIGRETAERDVSQ